VSKYAKWDSIQEIEELGLRGSPAYIFDRNDWDGIVDAIRCFDYCCGLRTDKVGHSTGLPFYLPNEVPCNVAPFIQPMHRMAYEARVDIIIVQFSPNLVEH